MPHDRLNTFLIAISLGCLIAAGSIAASPSAIAEGYGGVIQKVQAVEAFEPQPGPEPVNTGGTVTRAKSPRIFLMLWAR